MAITRDAISELIYSSCILLDEERYDDWLDRLCHPAFHYTITAYSTEIRKRMTWLDHGVDALRHLCMTIAEHVTYLGRFHRHATLHLLSQSADRAEAVSSLVVIHADLEGASRFYAAGRCKDSVDISGEAPCFLARNVDLDTRVLEFGSHRPL